MRYFSGFSHSCSATHRHRATVRLATQPHRRRWLGMGTGMGWSSVRPGRTCACCRVMTPGQVSSVGTPSTRQIFSSCAFSTSPWNGGRFNSSSARMHLCSRPSTTTYAVVRPARHGAPAVQAAARRRALYCMAERSSSAVWARARARVRGGGRGYRLATACGGYPADQMSTAVSYFVAPRSSSGGRYLSRRAMSAQADGASRRVGRPSSLCRK